MVSDYIIYWLEHLFHMAIRLNLSLLLSKQNEMSQLFIYTVYHITVYIISSSLCYQCYDYIITERMEERNCETKMYCTDMGWVTRVMCEEGWRSLGEERKNSGLKRR